MGPGGGIKQEQVSLHIDNLYAIVCTSFHPQSFASIHTCDTVDVPTRCSTSKIVFMDSNIIE